MSTVVTPGLTETENIMRIDTEIKNNPGREVILQGTFPFGPTGSVTIRNPVTIIGDTQGATIVGGRTPFLVNLTSPTSRDPVVIRDLRFVNPTRTAIRVEAVNNLEIANCQIENVTPEPAPPQLPADVKTAAGIMIATPNSAGQILIVDNPNIDIGGGSSDRTVGIGVNRAGSSGRPANLLIARNTVRNTTAHGIDVRDITGQATIEENTIITGLVGSQPQSLAGTSAVDGIRCLGTGRYTVQNNPKVDCAYENAAGIRLQQSAAPPDGTGMPVTGAVVRGNTVKLSMKFSPISERPKGAPMGPYFPYTENAGIELRKNCSGNEVSANTISGQGRAALSLVSETGFTALNDNRLLQNTHAEFHSHIADIFIGQGVTRTVIQGGPGTIVDNGTGTIPGSYTPPPPPGEDPHPFDV